MSEDCGGGKQGHAPCRIRLPKEKKKKKKAKERYYVDINSIDINTVDINSVDINSVLVMYTDLGVHNILQHNIPHTTY